MLESRKWKYMETGRYQKATRVDHQIKRAKSLLSHEEMRKIKRGQVEQKRSIRDAYNCEIEHFERAWDDYFSQIKEREAARLGEFRRSQRHDIQKAREKLRRKCNTLKNTSRQIIDLEKQEQHYLEAGDVQQLALVRQQKRE